MPRSPHDLGNHTLVFYIEPLMRITDPAHHPAALPGCHDGLRLDRRVRARRAHQAGSGIGLLPAFLGDREPGLVRLFPVEVSIPLDYLASLAPRVLRRPRPAWSWTS
ncbi:hypothetical protein ACU610_07345 [Geodermatophilus sp. URMC 61]|uniref:hypothetical protein n=1 Tax=Geodermatophilus sp. URMC 61 TaxID=3423411 RepID=UPI00406D0388